MNILIGGSGLLGSHLCLENTFTPFHCDLDVTSIKDILDYIIFLRKTQDVEIDQIILCAAYTNVAKANFEKEKAFEVNVTGVKNVIQAMSYLPNSPCLTYISTDYVFSGEKGHYKKNDPIDPVPNNYYALTKAMGEVAVSTLFRHKIIRTSFCRSDKWPFEKAFEDQFTSRDTIDIIAPKIKQIIEDEKYGIFHVGTERKSVYDLARRINPNVKPCSRLEIKEVTIPFDTSLLNE